MKTLNVLRLILILTVIGAAACTPKNQPRQVHESKRQWTPTQTPDDPSVDANAYGTFNLAKSYEDLKNTDASFQMKRILLPLSSIVLNHRFLGAPANRTTRMLQMIHVFHQAFVAGLDRNDQSADFKVIKEKYYQTVFAGCSADLREDCVNADFFSNDARFTRAMTKLAQDLDADIERELAANKKSPSECVRNSEVCRERIEERYRRLSMGNMKKNRNDDPEFNFAYLKYARLFASLLEFDKQKGKTTVGYIAEVHGKIFETIIARYNPKSLTDGEFKSFVENFNPWSYSQKQANTFQYGTKIMFKYGAACCLYEDAGKTKLSAAVKTAIAESQSENDAMGSTFLQMVKEIKEKFGTQLFKNLGLAGDLSSLEDVNSSFYDEYFLVVDRLFRGHLNTQEMEMVLRNTPVARTRERLPKTIALYIRVYLIHMLVDTNKHMTGIYGSNVASDKIFEEATTRSRELTTRWHTIQTQVELLESVLGAYFKGQNTPGSSVAKTIELIKSVNRNIHYISVYPNMIVMNYFLAKMKGKIVVNTWWGRIEINADTILDAFFDGQVPSPWFRFGKDVETLDRQMLLFSWDYMLMTDSLKGIDREKFFETVFSKYVDDNGYELRKRINDLERDTYGNFNFANVEAVCDYEMDNKRIPPAIKINFLELNRYTYSGLGENGINALLGKLLSDPAQAMAYYRDQVDFRLTYIRAMIELVEKDLMVRGEIKVAGQVHKETARGYEVLREFEEMKMQLARLFVPKHKRLFECALRLQEIERRRANRLYDEERQHLGMVFDQIRPLVQIKDKAELDARVKEINQNVFTAANNYKFDSVHGLTYRMSRFDLMMRMKKRIEDDIFIKLNAEEQRVYGATNAEYARPRSVSVYMPEGLARHDMITQETANTIYVNGDTETDRAAFIRDGMAALNGKTGSFVEWHGQRANDRSLTYYLNSLKEFYLVGPQTDSVKDSDGKARFTKYEVTAADLTDAFVKVYASYTLDEVDLKNSLEFKNDGRFERSFYEGTFFEQNGARLPFFYDLMLTTKGRAGTNTEGRSEGSSALSDAYNFAQTMINLRFFVFEPSPEISAIVKRLYGQRANFALQRMSDLYEHIANIEKSSGDAANLDPRLRNPLLMVEGRPYRWYGFGASLADEQKRRDLNILIDDFARRTDNFYGTREAVKVKVK